MQLLSDDERADRNAKMAKLKYDTFLFIIQKLVLLLKLWRITLAYILILHFVLISH